MSNKRKVNKIDSSGNVIDTYESILSAARACKTGNIEAARVSIQASIRRRCKAYGYNWTYADNTTNFSKDSTKNNEKKTFRYTESDDSATLEGIIEFDPINRAEEHTGRSRILEQFLDRHQVDLNKWSVKEWEAKEWDTPMKLKTTEVVSTDSDDGEKNDKLIHIQRGYQLTNYFVKVRLVPNVNRSINEGIKAFIKDIPKFKYVTNTPKFQHGNGILLEVAPFDVHFGKAATSTEIHYCDYNLQIAQRNFKYVIHQTLAFAEHFNPEKIIFIIGQDLMHIDNMKNETSKAENRLDVDGRMPNVYEKTFESVLNAIYYCRALAPVDIKWIPGNHDYLSSLFMCYALHEHFKDDKFVNVDIYDDDGKNDRKAVLWGNLLVGWTHQIVRRQEAWVNELAQHFPKLWGDSKFREWHFGDQHKKKEQRMTPLFTAGGVTLRQLTALSLIDKWHYDNLYTDAVPGGEAFIWSKDSGVFSNFTAWVGNLKE